MGQSPSPAALLPSDSIKRPATVSNESSPHTGNGSVEERGDELAQLPLVDPCSF
jgi:hypothetical protein